MTGAPAGPCPLSPGACRRPRPRRTAHKVSGAAALAVVVLTATSCRGVAPSAANIRLVDIGAGLQGPAGLKASVYAVGLPKVSTLAPDSQGRLWVATADATDHGNDGVYVVPSPGAPPVEAVSGVHTPLGLLWYQDWLYVSSTRRVDAYRDFDGTRFLTRRTILTFPAGTGESNELVLSPGGRMQMGISAPCDHCTPTSKWSASIVSFRPDGSDLRIDESGIRAPVGLVYFPHSNDLLVTMNQRDDLGARTPGDWLARVEPGQDWRFPNCFGQGGAACVGVPKPTAVLDKHAAVSGLAIVSGQLGTSVGTAALVAEWAFGKVQRVALTPGAATHGGLAAPFLTGLKNPVPVIIAPDGALLVGDWATGTVYRISTG